MTDLVVRGVTAVLYVWAVIFFLLGLINSITIVRVLHTQQALFAVKLTVTVITVAAFAGGYVGAM